MNALRVSLSLRAKKNQCRKTSHTQSRSHTDFAPLFDERCNYNAMIEYMTVKNVMSKLL
jgi:hypothetical protein